MIGLQAITKYASLMFSNGVSVSIAATETSGDNLASFDINNDNSVVEYRKELTKISDIRVNTNGTGCFLFQVCMAFTSSDLPYELDPPQCLRSEVVLCFEVRS